MSHETLTKFDAPTLDDLTSAVISRLDAGRQLQHGDIPERSDYRQFERLLIRAGWELAK